MKSTKHSRRGFLAGAAGETRSLEALRTDDAYASLLPQPPLEGLLPE